MHKLGPHMKFRPPRQPLDGKPFAKGVILKVLIKKPKKPNSANRKCVLVRLSTGKEMVAYGKYHLYIINLISKWTFND
jgi:small subunit ribosomal protein S12